MQLDNGITKLFCGQKSFRRKFFKNLQWNKLQNNKAETQKKIKT